MLTPRVALGGHSRTLAHTCALSPDAKPKQQADRRVRRAWRKYGYPRRIKRKKLWDAFTYAVALGAGLWVLYTSLWAVMDGAWWGILLGLSGIALVGYGLSREGAGLWRAAKRSAGPS